MLEVHEREAIRAVADRYFETHDRETIDEMIDVLTLLLVTLRSLSKLAEFEG